MSKVKSRDDFITDPEEQFRIILDSLGDHAIFMLDVYGNIHAWSPGAENIFGYAEHEIAGRHFSLLYVQDEIDRGSPESELNKARQSGSYEVRAWRVRKDHSSFRARGIITPVYNSEKKLKGYACIISDLTEKKKAEEEFLSTQRQYNLMLQAINAVKDYSIITLDENGYIASWNAGAERINGYSAKEIIGRHFSAFYPNEAVEAGYPDYELERAVKESKYQDEGWRKRKDGTLFWANVIINPIWLEEKLVGFSKITQDLSERKKVEEMLREEQDKFRLLVDGILDYGIFMLDTAGYITSWNKGAEKIKGYTRGEILGRHFSVFYPPKAVESGYPQYELKEALARGRFEDDGWRIRKDGSLFWANVIITPIYKEDKHIGYSKVTRDLTAQKKIEKALKESEERWRLLVDSIRDYAVFMLDPYGNITTWNSGAERIKGYTSEEIIGKHFSVFYEEDAVKAGIPMQILAKTRESGRIDHEGWRIRKDGSRFWANVIMTSIKNPDGKIIGFTKVTRDLTEAKRAEMNLIRKNEELRRLNADLDNFVYTASHDLKAPVSNIEGLLSALNESFKEKGLKDEDIQIILDMMESSVQRFRRTIYDLADITKVQSDVMEGASEINLEDIVDEVKESISGLISSAQAEIITRVNGCKTIYAVQSGLRAILYNLLSNAIKYRHPERKALVEVECRLQKEYYILEVMDNGLGIPEKHQHKIFTMFKRLHDHVDGTGIGLFLVKRIVDNMEAKIEVESKLNEGSIFRVYLKKQDINEG